ncbi:hypothetical protein BKA63DRAFT_207223 [Paraphoma chrysanthemicola]|nr:hypothetical protein BKA63DRAFT_207223 [Paraphoma chrysanthemicola]
MPSFTFWKSAKADETKSPLLSDAHGTSESAQVVRIAGKIDLNPGNEESGVFVFEDVDSHHERSGLMAYTDQDSQAGRVPRTHRTSLSDADATLLSDEQVQRKCEVSPEEAGLLPLSRGSNAQEETASMQAQEALVESPQKRVLRAISQDRDSGVYFSTDSEQSPSSRPISVASRPAHVQPRPSSLALRDNPVANTQRVETTPRRLHRPTELNLGATDTSTSKPKSELEKRFDLMRNSKTQSKAALRSPTELLKERLNMSPKKGTHGEKIRAFVPPQPSRNGCLLPGPVGQPDGFTSTSVRARTETGGRPAWWCKFDKLVVFDGAELRDGEEPAIRTRTSKGLSIARRRGDTETIIIPMNCAHCQDMLNRHEWKYDIQVCRRSVCWECRERCKWEQQQEMKARDESNAWRGEGNRDRADSVLQDKKATEEHLMRKMGIEQGRPKSPIEAVGGIEERLENAIRRSDVGF